MSSSSDDVREVIVVYITEPDKGGTSESFERAMKKFQREINQRIKRGYKLQGQHTINIQVNEGKTITHTYIHLTQMMYKCR